MISPFFKRFCYLFRFLSVITTYLQINYYIFFLMTLYHIEIKSRRNFYHFVYEFWVNFKIFLFILNEFNSKLSWKINYLNNLKKIDKHLIFKYNKYRKWQSQKCGYHIKRVNGTSLCQANVPFYYLLKMITKV